MEDFNSKSNTFPYSQHSRSSNNATADVAPHMPDSAGSNGGGGGGGGGAKYKLMSPAKLPISRSTTGITIPPGLSPTSFLESPVLLSNIKAEPSPTTGSFFMAQFMQGKTAAMSLEKSYTSCNDVDENASSSFEFKFHTGSSTAAGSSSLTVPAVLTKNGLVNQDDGFSQSPVDSALITHEQPSTEELRVAAPTGMLELPVCSPGDEQNQGGQSNLRTQLSSSDQKDSISSIPAEKTSDDGYNWRKYGQKLVKGSEFPRSYYKCTYPNCEVKKIFERSPSGQIIEIVYKGSHDHPKPQAARRNNPGALMSIQEEKMDKDFSFTGQEDKLNTNGSQPDVSLALSPRQANMETLEGSRSQIQGINDDIDEDDPFSKRRKMEDGLDVTPIIKPIREPRVVVQTVSEVDILDDGYRWRKYGQKVVRGNPNPRSYYKCTSPGCPVRKHVERASHDPKAVITTYEGKHNHDLPTAKNSGHEFAERVQYAKMNRPDEISSVSLDLGVGIRRVPDTTTNEQQAQAFNAEAVRGQIPPNNSSMMVVQASQSPTWSSFVNGRLNMYGSRENHVEGRSSLQTPPIHPSNQCPGNLGRILMEH